MDRLTFWIYSGFSISFALSMDPHNLTWFAISRRFGGHFRSGVSSSQFCSSPHRYAPYLPDIFGIYAIWIFLGRSGTSGFLTVLVVFLLGMRCFSRLSWASCTPNHCYLPMCIWSTLSGYFHLGNLAFKYRGKFLGYWCKLD